MQLPIIYHYQVWKWDETLSNSWKRKCDPARSVAANVRSWLRTALLLLQAKQIMTAIWTWRSGKTSNGHWNHFKLRSAGWRVGQGEAYVKSSLTSETVNPAAHSLDSLETTRNESLPNFCNVTRQTSRNIQAKKERKKKFKLQKFSRRGFTSLTQCKGFSCCEW